MVKRFNKSSKYNTLSQLKYYLREKCKYSFRLNIPELKYFFYKKTKITNFKVLDTGFYAMKILNNEYLLIIFTLL